MERLVDLTHENLAYWSRRSGSYSDVNKGELKGESRGMWGNALSRRISSQFAGRNPEDIHVLDIGTGPGFFAILLTGLGYRVTAVDLTSEMIEEAKINAGDLSELIDFREMNAEALDIEDGSFDVVVSRNLTWNLPHPDQAYREWCRVLKSGGLLLNFDANWYSYLFDEDARKAYEADRLKSEALGLGDQNIGEHFDVMEDIAVELPLSRIARPDWDIAVLAEMGMHTSADTEIWRKVWTVQEQVNFSSTPMFMISAIKQATTAS